MNVLLVGAGPMAAAHARVLRTLGIPFDVIGRGEQSAARFFMEVGVRPVVGGLTDYLARRRIINYTHVIVAVPIPRLADVARGLIAAGARRLLVEKPAGLDLLEIESVAAAAHATQADVFVAYNRRFFGSVAEARTRIAQDGGVSSFHVDFTELADRVVTPDKDLDVLANWLLANSSHVLDLAFHLGGRPIEMNGAVNGSLGWHPAGAVFAGHGRTTSGALFTWHADWGSAGRWGLDLRTSQRRLLLQPLESLHIQEKSGFSLLEVLPCDNLDRDYKPGIYRQMQAFLSINPAASALPTIAEHASAVRNWFLPMLQPQAARRLRVGAHPVRTP
jgi:predicted dehydrogenase